MSAQTTLVKPRLEQQAPRGLVEVPPAINSPSISELKAKLAEFERATEELEDYKGRAARAALEEDRALEDAGLTEAEAAARISRAQNERNVYKARQAQREKAIAALFTELSSAIGESHLELRGLVDKEVSRRTKIIEARVLEAIEAVDGHGRAQAVSEVLEYSGPLERVKALGPVTFMSMPGDWPYLVQQSKDVFAKYAQVLAEAEKKL